MRSLEELTTHIRDPKSREHFGEAVRAYQAGAYRSAVVSTWIAVAVDLIDKVRLLAEGGDGAAQSFVTELNNAISVSDKRQLQTLESVLVERAEKVFQMLSPREAEELKRLYEDRHVCAHPAFVDPGDLFAPRPEQCLAYLTMAVDLVLSRGATPGKVILERFKSELRGESWTASDPQTFEHLRQRYFTNTRDTAQRSLVSMVVAACIHSKEEPTFILGRLRQTVRGFATLAPGLLNDALQQKVEQREETPGLTDEELVMSMGLLGENQAFWDALPSSSHPRALAALRKVDAVLVYRATNLNRPLARPEANAILASRLDELDQSLFLQLASKQPSPPALRSALSRLQAAGTYAQATLLLNEAVSHMSRFMTSFDLYALGASFSTNRQVRSANAAAAVLENIRNSRKWDERSEKAWSVLGERLERIHEEESQRLALDGFGMPANPYAFLLAPAQFEDNPFF